MAEKKGKFVICAPATPALLAMDGNSLTECANCGERLVISREAREIGVDPWCMKCAAEVAGDKHIAPAPPHVRAAIEKQFGPLAPIVIDAIGKSLPIKDIMALLKDDFPPGEQKGWTKR